MCSLKIIPFKSTLKQCSLNHSLNFLQTTSASCFLAFFNTFLIHFLIHFFVGTQAEKEGSVQEHDYLIHIAEHNVCFSEFDEAMDILKSADRPLTMWFRRLNESSIAGIKAAKENAGK